MDKQKKSKKADKKQSTSSTSLSGMKVEDEDEEYFDALEFVDESSTGGKSDCSSSGFKQKESLTSSNEVTSDYAGICEGGNGDVDVDPVTTAAAAGVPEVVDNKYYIENIVNYRVTVDRGRAMERFQAKWYNWPPETNTWEPHSHVDHCHNMIVRFFKANPRKYQLYLQYGDTVKTAYPRIRIPGHDSGSSMSKTELEPEPEAIAKRLASKRKMIDNRVHIYDENSNKYIPVAVECEIKDQKVKRIQGHYRSPELTAYLIRLSGHHVHKSIWVKDIDTEELSGFYEKIKLYHKRLCKELLTPSC